MHFSFWFHLISWTLDEVMHARSCCVRCMNLGFISCIVSNPRLKMMCGVVWLVGVCFLFSDLSGRDQLIHVHMIFLVLFKMFGPPNLFKWNWVIRPYTFAFPTHICLGPSVCFTLLQFIFMLLLHPLYSFDFILFIFVLFYF